MKKIYCILALGVLSFGTQAQNNWQLLDSITNDNINSVFFLNGQKGWLATERTIARTDNAGGIFYTGTMPAALNFIMYNGVHFINEQKGYAWGGSYFGTHRDVVVRSVDGGVTWDSVFATQGGGSAIREMAFIDTNKAWLYSDMTNLYYTDDMQTFDTVSKPQNIAITSLAAFSASRALVGGYQLQTGVGIANMAMFLTNDGGQNWQQTYTDPAIQPTSIAFKDNNTGYAACNKGYILLTTDGGQSWTTKKIASDSIGFHKVVVFGDKSVALLASKAQSFNSDVYLSNDNGSTWQVSLTVPNEYMTGIAFTDVDTGYAVSWRKIYRTINGGGVTAVNDMNTAAGVEIDVYPNPANDKIYLHDKKGILQSATLYDMAGRKVMTAGEGVKELNVSQLPAGNYSLLLETAKGVVSRKLTIK